MAKRIKVKGKEIMLFLSDKAIALATSCDLTINAETEKTVTKDDGLYADKSVVAIDFSGSSDSVVGASVDSPADLTHEELMDLLIAAQPVDMIIGKISSSAEIPDTGWAKPTNNGYKGKILITSVGLTAPQTGTATCKISFEGTGALSKIEAG